jgi:hypothetical protein
MTWSRVILGFFKAKFDVTFVGNEHSGCIVNQGYYSFGMSANSILGFYKQFWQ